MTTRSGIMTRRMASQNTEVKLKIALEELKQSRESCDQLLRERDESEAEIKITFDKNSQLKKELAELHAQHQEVTEHRDELLKTINTFDQCSNLFEQTLVRNNELEIELRDANRTLLHLEEEKNNQEFSQTLNLYEELIGSPGGHAVVSDLRLNSNSAQLLKTNKQIRLSSNNKAKKYIKISKFITKTNKLIKKQKCFYNNILLRKQRIELVDSLEIYNNKLHESRCKYDVDIERLQADISRLHDSLKSMTIKYNSAQDQINEHILAANKLLELDNSNQDFKSLPNIKITQVLDKSLQMDASRQLSISASHSQLTSCKPVSNVIVFSDRLGVGYGSLLHKSIKCNVTNNCMPDASYDQIMKRIENSKFNSQSILVILIGNSKNITKKNIIKNFSILSSLHVKKVVLCALPYCRYQTTEENDKIHLLNSVFYNLTERHSDKFVFFDTNKFTNNKFVLTGGFLHLPYKLKKQIATLLAYNINNLLINKKSNCDQRISSSTNLNIIPVTISNNLN